jgi:uncharacterized protein (TIGR03437 family)
MRKLLNALTIVALAIFPITALANITGTVTLDNQYLNLDTGATGYYVNDDIYYLSLGSTIQLMPVGGARLYNLPTGFSGLSNFDNVTLSQLEGYSYDATPILPTSLAVGDIFAVRTNGGNYAAVLVTAVGANASSITIEYSTFITGIPVITQVLNNYSLLPLGVNNSGIAQGSLFIIKGANLASATTAVLQSSAPPGLPTTLNGATVSLTVDGFPEPSPVFYYAIASQLALVMPSSVHTGSGTITVTYNGQTSTPYQFYVVPSAMGFDAYYGIGSGLGVATDPGTGALYNYGNSIPAGTTVVLWGSGLGADPARDTTYNAPAGGFPINGLSAIYVGGVQGTIQYQGASGYPGLNQVNVVIPANAPTGCNVSVTGVSAAGVPTNVITLPIGTGFCEDPGLGTSGNTLSTLSGQPTVNTGSVQLSYNSTTLFSALPLYSAVAASFQNTAGGTFGANSAALSPGGCNLSASQPYSSPATSAGLSAGAITITGPNGSSTLPAATGSSSQDFPAGFVNTSGGTFKIQAAAGAQVGAFTTQVVFSNPLFTWTNQVEPVNITRSAGWTVTWSGAPADSYVSISGANSTGVFSTEYTSFTCVAPANEGQFTVPPYILAALPASNGNGLVSVSNVTLPQTFTATGLDYGFATTAVNYSADANFQ